MGLVTLSRLEDKSSVVDKIWFFIFDEFRKYMKSFASLQTRRKKKNSNNNEKVVSDSASDDQAQDDKEQQDSL